MKALFLRMKNALQSKGIRVCARETIWEADYRSAFQNLVLLSLAFYLLVAILSLGWSLPSAFFLRCSDAFMDFFNSIRDASQGEAVYTERSVIYPPLANLLFWLLSFLLPDAYNNTSFDDRLEWVQHPTAVVLIIFVSLLSLALLFYTISKLLRGDKKTVLLFGAIGVCTIPVLDMIERGNIMVLAIAGVFVFATTYENKQWYLRELGILALAFACAIKLYPAMLALILLADKRVWALLRCALYSTLLVLIPSFAFGGPNSLFTLVENILLFTNSTKNHSQTITDHTVIPAFVTYGFFWGLFSVFLVTFLVQLFLLRKSTDRYKIWISACGALVAFPPLTSTYAWTLFFIPLALLCSQGICVKDQPFLFFSLVVPFLFFPIPSIGIMTFSSILVYFGMIALAIYTVRTLSADLRTRKASTME